MDYKILIVIVFFFIIISIQYTLNRIYKELKDIKQILKYRRDKD